MMKSRDKHEKLALDMFMILFFVELLQKVHDFSVISVGFTFSIDYAWWDRMTLGGLLQPTSSEMFKMFENFAVIIQSGQNRPKSLEQDHLMNIFIYANECPLDLPLCMACFILLLSILIVNTDCTRT